MFDATIDKFCRTNVGAVKNRPFDGLRGLFGNLLGLGEIGSYADEGHRARTGEDKLAVLLSQSRIKSSKRFGICRHVR